MERTFFKVDDDDDGDDGDDGDGDEKQSMIVSNCNCVCYQSREWQGRSSKVIWTNILHKFQQIYKNSYLRFYLFFEGQKENIKVIQRQWLNVNQETKTVSLGWVSPLSSLGDGGSPTQFYKYYFFQPL